jgi:hypothetical protein
LKKVPLEPQKLLKKLIAKAFASAVVHYKLQCIHGAPAPFDSSISSSRRKPCSFRRFFETAKAKFPQCNSRVRLKKKRD